MQTFINAVWTRQIALLLAVVIGLVSLAPRVEAGFIPSSEYFSAIDRDQDLESVQKALEHKLVKERLKALGYSEEEIAQRLDKLSDGEIHALAAQLDALVPAGDGIGLAISVLVIILLVLLILEVADRRIVIT